MRLINLDDTGFKDGVYSSFPLKMTPKTTQYRELEKARYIKDKRERLKKVRELLKDENNNGVHVERGGIIDFKKSGFQTFEAYTQKKSNGMFFNVWVEISIKRELEIECYLLDIFDKADELAKTDEYKAINYLIDEKYKNHTGLFDKETDDFIYNDEYNELIYDLLQNKINEISKTEIIPIGDTIRKVTKKPLTWNANKNTIGTLFGMLHSVGIIQGNKTDLVRGIGSLFSNLSEATLRDNINLTFKQSENKPLYDEETEKMLKEWVSFLVEQKNKPRKTKSTPKQK